MSAVSCEPGARQIYVPYVMWFPIRHQIEDQMMNSRILRVILLIGIIAIAKQRERIARLITKQRGPFDAYKKFLVLFCDLFGEVLIFLL